MKYIISTGSYNKEKYSLHEHELHEIVFYCSGVGKLQIDGKVYQVKKGDYFIIPPKSVHSSISYENLRFISIIGNVDGLIHVETPFVSNDESGEGLALAQMVLENRYGNEEYLNALCRACVLYALKNVDINTEIEKAVYKIKKIIGVNFQDSDFEVTKLLNDSGYAEDYIRANFRRIIGKTPVEFLNEMRIHNAKTLIKIYQNSMPMSEIASRCGFEDYIYFSKKFKSIVGVSPYEYKKTILSKN